MRPVLVSGASATGKTTLIGLLIQSGFMYLPKHTTRAMRSNEDPLTNDVTLSMDEFKRNFLQGDYLEGSLEEAKFKSKELYYGTPRSWLRSLASGDACATPVSPSIATKICGAVDVTWVHLVCEETERRRRLEMRGYSLDDVQLRMDTLKYWVEGFDGAIVFDTSLLSPQVVAKLVMGATNRDMSSSS